MKTVLIFGDSNSYGTPPMAALGVEGRYDAHTRWPRVMAATLGLGYHLVEEGHPGRTTAHDDPIEGIHRNGARIIAAMIESHKPIDLLIIMLGTNDFKHRFSLNAVDVAHGVGRLVDMARRGDYVGEVLLIAPPPVLERGVLAGIFADAETKSPHYAAELAIIAQDRRAHFLDAGAYISVDSLDGVHFDAAAHRQLGHAVAEFIKEKVEKHD